MLFIKARDLKFNYQKYNEEGEVSQTITAVDGVSLDIEPGSFVCVLGHNGSGKSTLARHMNVLVTPTEGTLWVDGKDTSVEDNILAIRKVAGMVFQNPDNQIVSSVVEEDVGFGPENIGVPTEEIWSRVEDSLTRVDMLNYRKHSPEKLSGGQKQRVAIAGVLAMRPKCIVLDEPTAMLDPQGRREVIDTIHDLNKNHGVTIILITHHLEEVVDADQIFVMNDGKVVMEGSPSEIFSNVEGLQEISMDVPQVTLLAHELRKKGLDIHTPILTRQELEKELIRLYQAGMIGQNMTGFQTEEAYKTDKENIADHQVRSSVEDAVLRLEHVSYTYGEGSSYELHALKDINLEIGRGQFIGLIGHTGSGKSTLIQHLNGLEKASSGMVYYKAAGGAEENIYEKGYSIKELCSKVGLVFQYPEYQLFEESVLKDVCFGPKNQGFSPEECQKKAKEALALVGIREDMWQDSPFELSGGQKRRVAIAGVLAMNPDVLILDEPTAGLDPKGREEILGQIAKLQKETKMTVILVSHSMEDVARYADRLIAMSHGQVILDGSPREVFSHVEELEKAGLAAPEVTYLMRELSQAGMPVNTHITTVAEAIQELC